MADNALGKILEIDQKTIDDIAGLGNSIVAIGEKAEDAAERFNKAFGSMGDSVSGLRDGLANLQNLIDAIDANKIQSGVQSFNDMAESSANAAVTISDVTTSISKFSEQSQSMENPFAKFNLEELIRELQSYWKQLDDVREELDILNQAYDTGKTELQSFALEGIESTEARATKLMSTISKLSALIEKVGSQKVNWDEEDRYDAWQNQQEAIYKAQLKAEEDKQRMQEALFQKQKEIWAAEDARTKKSIEDYQSEQRELEKMYAQMFDIIEAREQAKQAREDKNATKAAQDEQKAYSSLETQLIRIRDLKLKLNSKEYTSDSALEKQFELYSRLDSIEKEIVGKMEDMRKHNSSLIDDEEKLVKSDLKRLDTEEKIRLAKEETVQRQREQWAEEDAATKRSIENYQTEQRELEKMYAQMFDLIEANERAQKEEQDRTAAKAAQEEQKAYSDLEAQLIRVTQLKQEAMLKGYDKDSATDEQKKYYQDIVDLCKKINDEREEMLRVNPSLVSNAESLLRAKEKELDVTHRLNQAEQEAYRQTKKGAMEYAASAKTYEQRAQAIRYIEEAMKNLNSESTTYKQDLNELTAKHKELKNAQVEVERAMGKVQGEASKLAATAKQLEGALAAAFSIRAIEGYIKKLVSIRGEFELQNVALGSILQNKERADQLFEKVTQLAVKSPYTVRQLTSYTKQLSAYQVEYEKLYTTTKQLADVSAGLGVDMQRLILAFGQVKAANYLRATEVRQFTEAGINILGELSKYYTELEEQMVSVADVQERITKRMVEFGDVEAVFERLTSAGGMFYKMQEKQSESLAGMMSNLQDRLDIMLNNIGKENESVIKGVINTLNSLLSNYESVVTVIKILVKVFILYKTNILVVTEAQKYLRWQFKAYIADAIASEKATTKFAAVLSLLGKGLKSAGSAVKGFISANGIAILLFVVTELLSAFKRWKTEVKEQQEEFNKLYEGHLSNLHDIKKGYDDIRKATAKASAEESKYAKDKAFSQKIGQLEKLFSAMEDAHIKPTIELDNVDESSIDSVFESNAAVYQKAQEFGYNLGTAFTQALSSRVSMAGMPSLHKAVEDMGKTFDNITAKLEPILSAYENKAKSVFNSLSKDTQSLINALDEGQREEEDEIAFLLRRLSLLQQITQDEQFSNKERKSANKELRKIIQDINQAEVGVNYGMQQITYALDEAYKGYDNLITEARENPIAFKAAIDAELARQQYDALTQEFMRKRLYLYYSLTPDPKQSEEETKTLGEIGDKIKALQESLGQKNLIPDSELKKLKTWGDVVEALRKKYKQLKTEKENLQGVTGVTGKTDAKAEYSDAVAAYNALLRMAQQFGIVLDTSNKADKTAVQIAKERIELLKKMRQEYEQNLKSMSSENAKQTTQLAFKDNEIYKQLEDLGVIDITMGLDANGVISALEKLAQVTTASAKKEIETMISQLRNEQVIIDIKANLDAAKINVDKLFDQYELSKKLKSLGLDESLAMQLFGMDSMNLDELEKELKKVKEKYAQNNKGIGTDAQTYFASLEDKLREQRTKNLEEMLKSYSKYLKEEFSTAVQIKMEEAKKLGEIDSLVAQGKFTSSQAKAAKEGVKNEATKKLTETNWKDFQQSELYLELFENLENVSTSVLEQMKAKLDDVGQSLKNLSPEALKQVRTQITEIDNQLADRSPLKSLKEDLAQIAMLKEMGITEQTLGGDMQSYSASLDALQQQKDLIDTVLSARESGVKISQEELDGNAQLAKYYEQDTDLLHQQSSELSGQIESTKEAITQTSKLLGIFKKSRTAVEAVQTKWNSILSIVKQLKSSVDKVWDAMGRTEDDEALETFINMGLELIELIASAMLFKASIDSCITSSEVLSVTLKTAIPIIGWIMLAVEAIASVLSAIISSDKQKFETQIEDRKEQVADLIEKFESLQEAIEDCYNISNLKSWNEEAKNTLEIAIAGEEAMVAAYKARKNGSKKYESEIEELETEIKEQKESLEELAENYTEALGGFGSASNLKSAAEDFVNAWVDAFEETGDGLSGLEEQLEEFMTNAVKKQALLRVSERFIKPLLDQIDEFSDKSKNLTDSQYIQGLAELMENLKSQLPELSSALEPFFSALSGINGDSLSGLASGIEGITEDTAEVLASIVESIRYFVANSNSILLNMSAILSTPTEENPWYYQLKRQADATVEIRDMVKKVSATVGLKSVLQVQIV